MEQQVPDSVIILALVALFVPIVIGGIVALIKGSINNDRLELGLHFTGIASERWHEENLAKVRRSSGSQLPWVIGGIVVGIILAAAVPAIYFMAVAPPH